MPVQPARRQPSYPVTSVDNALRLILMLRDRGEVRGREAATELGIAPSSVHRLMSMLVYRGFAVQGASREYQPGPSIKAKPEPLPEVRWLSELVRPHLVGLSERLGETTYLEVLVGADVRFLLTAEGGIPLRAEDRAGFIIPAATSAAGRAMLAAMSDESVDRVFSDGTELGPDRRELLAGELRAVRSLGYAWSVEEVEKGIASIAVPLRIRGMNPPAAISVACPAHRHETLRSDESIAAVMAARDMIERDIQAMDSIPPSGR